MRLAKFVADDIPLIPHYMLVAEYYGITLVVPVSVLSVCPPFHPSVLIPSVFSVQMITWVFIKLDMCIDIVQICFGIAYEQIL